MVAVLLLPIHSNSTDISCLVGGEGVGVGVRRLCGDRAEVVYVNLGLDGALMV